MSGRKYLFVIARSVSDQTIRTFPRQLAGLPRFARNDVSAQRVIRGGLFESVAAIAEIKGLMKKA